MHDLPPSTPTSLLPNSTPPSGTSFPWWKTAVVVMVFLTIVVSWMGTERTLVRPEKAPSQAQPVTYTAAERNRLARQYVSDPQSLSDEQYRAAALAREAEMARQRQQQHAVTYRPPVDTHYRWQKRVDRLRKNLHGVSEFPENSVQWHMRKQLEDLLQEEPQD